MGIEADLRRELDEARKFAFGDEPQQTGTVVDPAAAQAYAAARADAFESAVIRLAQEVDKLWAARGNGNS